MLSTDFLEGVASPEYVDDPYPFLRRLRETAPAVETAAGIWLVGRYADVARGIRDEQLSCDFASLESYAAYFRARGIDERFPLPLNALDPPDHRRIRAVVGHQFHAKLVEVVRPMVERTVAEVLDKIVHSGRTVVDLVADIAFPVPIAVIGALFGIPAADWPMLRRWSEAFGAVSDPDPLLSDEQRRAAAGATAQAGEYFGRMVLDRRRAPGSDLMSRWLDGYRTQRSVSIPELLVNGVFLLIVGHHNTVSLICNGMLALLRHPDQLDRLRRDPALMPNAVEELLRYDSPVQTSTRVTTGPYTVDGVQIPPRRQVMLLVGSANRDGTAFAEPDRLDLARPDAGRNLGFGRGIHACIGGPLARLEAGLTLSGMLRRFPVIEADGPVRRRVPCFTLRGMAGFPIRLRATPVPSRLSRPPAAGGGTGRGSTATVRGPAGRPAR